ncbi:alpha-galactosidase, partial [Paractinoplanes deccanensis]|uniref:alpha-galactosidase n=1 Tax=Paractinoplanes deccanensis TaxID=113561 RepID=UPI0031D9C637
MRRLKTMLAAALLLLSGTAFAATATPAQALDNGVGRTPPMGWNSWNTFFCNINESLIRGMADAMVSSGMRDAGYQYVVVDDCWMNPNRDASGNLQGDPSRFPSGMKALGDYIHARGLKFGIYQVPLDRTCA